MEPRQAGHRDRGPHRERQRHHGEDGHSRLGAGRLGQDGVLRLIAELRIEDRRDQPGLVEHHHRLVEQQAEDVGDLHGPQRGHHDLDRSVLRHRLLGRGLLPQDPARLPVGLLRGLLQLQSQALHRGARLGQGQADQRRHPSHTTTPTADPEAAGTPGAGDWLCTLPACRARPGWSP
nr:hypothetical protein GCM10020093_031150 [Planobispora longispora]